MVDQNLLDSQLILLGCSLDMGGRCRSCLSKKLKDYEIKTEKNTKFARDSNFYKSNVERSIFQNCEDV